MNTILTTPIKSTVGTEIAQALFDRLCRTNSLLEQPTFADYSTYRRIGTVRNSDRNNGFVRISHMRVRGEDVIEIWTGQRLPYEQEASTPADRAPFIIRITDTDAFCEQRYPHFKGMRDYDLVETVLEGLRNVVRQMGIGYTETVSDDCVPENEVRKALSAAAGLRRRFPQRVAA